MGRLLWTGHLTFELFTATGHPLGQAELRVWREYVDVWFQDHCLAVLDRDHLREWIGGARREELRRHEVTFVEVENRIAVRFGDDALPHRLPLEITAHLARL